MPNEPHDDRLFPLPQRDSIMFTETQRAFIRGEHEYSGRTAKQQRYQMRERIRKRIVDALADFAFVCEYMEDRETERVFATLVEDEDIEAVPTLARVLELIYVGAFPEHNLFEASLERGVRNAERRQLGEDTDKILTVDFDVKRTPVTEVRMNEIFQKINQLRWGDLTEPELRWFFNQYAMAGGFDPEFLPEEFKNRLRINSTYDYATGADVHKEE